MHLYLNIEISKLSGLPVPLSSRHRSCLPSIALLSSSSCDRVCQKHNSTYTYIYTLVYIYQVYSSTIISTRCLLFFTVMWLTWNLGLPGVESRKGRSKRGNTQIYSVPTLVYRGPFISLVRFAAFTAAAAVSLLLSRCFCHRPASCAPRVLLFFIFLIKAEYQLFNQSNSQLTYFIILLNPESGGKSVGS